MNTAHILLEIVFEYADMLRLLTCRRDRSTPIREQFAYPRGERLASLKLWYYISLLTAVYFYAALEMITHTGIYLVSRATRNFRHPPFTSRPADAHSLRSCEDYCYCNYLHSYPAVGTK